MAKTKDTYRRNPISAKNKWTYDKNNLLKSQLPFRFKSFCSFVFSIALFMYLRIFSMLLNDFTMYGLGVTSQRMSAVWIFSSVSANFRFSKSPICLSIFNISQICFLQCILHVVVHLLWGVKVFCDHSFRRYVIKKSNFRPKTKGSAIKIIN